MDLTWEMQGELGTSHAYAWGGDVPQPPEWTVGQLAINYQLSDSHQAFQVTEMIEGDLWDKGAKSPLMDLGVNVGPGDLIWAVNGQSIDAQKPLEALLVHAADQDITLTVSKQDASDKRIVTVHTLADVSPAHYREWVNQNRQFVHEQSQGRLGYVHIPDMGQAGFAEFHRGYLAECDRGAMVIDVRYNGGGNVSWLLLEKLMRKHLGYDHSRWQSMTPYPGDSGSGIMVCLANEFTGSDGDMFTHAFKMLKLGPVIGKRTWGGVIGISPRHALVDGGMTSQPEYSFWFKDVGWAIENYGVDPDIEIEYAPQDYHASHDPQLQYGVNTLLQMLAERSDQALDFGNRPNLAWPKNDAVIKV